MVHLVVLRDFCAVINDYAVQGVSYLSQGIVQKLVTGLQETKSSAQESNNLLSKLGVAKCTAAAVYAVASAFYVLAPECVKIYALYHRMPLNTLDRPSPARVKQTSTDVFHNLAATKSDASR